MIVVQAKSNGTAYGAGAPARLTIARQPDHAAMCGSLAAAWRRPTEIPEGIWPRFVEAVRRHDDGWIEAERHPAINDQGQPHDFKSLPTQAHAAIWRRSVDLAEAVDPYMALLTALHARWLYSHVTLHTAEAEQREAQRLMAEMAQRADGYIETLRERRDSERSAVEPAALAAARSLLTLLDRLSLMLIGGVEWCDELGPAAFNDCQAVLQMPQADGEMANGQMTTCDPWPFEGTSLVVGCDLHEVDAAAAGESVALGERLACPPTRRCTWTLVPTQRG